MGPGAASANEIVSCSRAGLLQGRYRVLGAAPLRLPGAVRVWRSALRPARIELATFRVLAGVVATRLWVHLVLAARAGQMDVAAQGWCRADTMSSALPLLPAPVALGANSVQCSLLHPARIELATFSVLG